MTCSSCSGASPAMPDSARRRPRRSRAWLLLAATLVLVAAVVPGVALANVGIGDRAAGGGTRIEALAPPTETCRPQETMSAGGFSDICGAAPGGGGGGLNLGGLLPIIAILVIGGAVALIAAFVVLRRTSAPLVPADPGEWWTCRNCGKTNVVGSARCYACGAWPR